MYSESTIYPQEIARLNYLIDLLITENEQLKQLLHTYPANITATQPDLPYQEQAGVVKQVFLPASPEVKMLKQVTLSNLRQESVTKQMLLSTLPEDTVVKQVFLPYLQEGSVANHVLLSNIPDGSVIKHVFLHTSLDGIPSAQVFAPFSGGSNMANDVNAHGNAIANVENQANGSAAVATNPATHYTLQDVQQSIADNKLHIRALYDALKESGGVNGTREALKNSATILKYIATATDTSGVALKRATFMSASGLSKRISILKRLGLIARVKYQQFTLTQKAIDLMMSASG